MKKILVLAMCMLSILVLAACGSDSASNGDKVVTLRLATQHPVEHVAQASAEAIKERIERETEGRVNIDIYPAQQLGDWSQIFEEVMRGTIDMAHISVPETYDPKVTVGFLPYLAKDYDELEKVFSKGSYLDNEMTKFQSALGIKFLGYYCEGFSGVGTVDAVTDANLSQADKNLLVRVPSIDAFKLPVERLGFRTSTIPYSDTFAAMQTGVVDGWAGGPPNLNYLTFRDVIKHYYQYNLTHESTQYLMNEKTFNSISESDQKIIEEAFREQCDKSFELAKSEDDKYIKMLEDKGIEITRFNEEELDAIANDIRENVWSQLTDKYPQELLDGIRESLK